MKKIIVLIMCTALIMCSVSAIELDFFAESADLSGSLQEQVQLAAVSGTGTIYDSVSADASYTLSYADGILTAATNTASSDKNFIVVPLSIEENRTYKVAFSIRVVSHGGAARTKAKIRPSWNFTGTGKVTGNSTDTTGSSHDAKAVELSISDSFTDFFSEISVKEITDRNNMAFKVSTNAIKKGSNVVTAPTYEIKDLAVFERCDIFYSAGSYCEIAEGASEIPTTIGVYLDGSEATKVKISSVTMPYVSKDERWYIDESKPWVDQDGNEYAIGEEIDFSVIQKSVVLTPNLKSNQKAYTVSFDAEGLSSSPTSVSVFENDTINLFNYGAAFADADGMRFAGWTTEKNGTEVVTEIVVTEDITLYPVINKNYDFAYDDAYSGTTVLGATLVKKLGKNTIGVTGIPDGTNAYISLGNPRLPTSLYKEIKIIFDAHSSQAAADKFTPEFASEFKGVYINTGSYNGADGQIKLLKGTDICSAEIIQENGKNYLELTIAADKSEYWTGILNFIRIDAYTGGPDFAVRRVEFVPYEEFEEKEINLVGFKKPETGVKATLAEDITDETDIAEVVSIEWFPALLPGKVFDAGISYSAKVVVRPADKHDKIFAEDIAVKVDGTEVAIQKYEDGSIGFELIYPTTTDMKRYTVTFDSTGLKPESVPTGVVAFEGKAFYVSAYNTAASSDSKLRFNGWALNPGETDLFKAVDSVVMTEDITLYPIISYDINLACTENQKNWKFGASVGEFTDDGYMLVTQTGSSTGVTAKLSEMNVSARLFTAVKIYFHGISNETFGIIYFNRTGELSETTERYLKGQGRKKDAETGYDVVTFPTLDVQNWNGTISSVRLDMNKQGAIAKVKAIVFEYPEIFDINNVSIDGIQKPEAGAVFDSDNIKVLADKNKQYGTFEKIDWTPSLRNGRFEENKEYTAKVFLAPQAGGRFDSQRQITMTFGDVVSDAAVDDEGRLYASFSFEKTGSYVPFTMKVEGESGFYVDEKEKQYKVVFEGDAPDEAVTWTIDKNEYLSVNNKGILSVIKNGATKIKLRATSQYNPNVYDEIDVETFIHDAAFEITGPETLYIEGRSEQYNLKVTSGTAYDRSATWSVDNTGVATIDKNTGKLTPKTNGTVNIKAVSNYNYSTCTFKVTIINHRELYSVTFDANTTDEVTDMPNGMQARSGDVITIEEIPVREGYVFSGWSVSSENNNVDNTFTVESNLKLYAVWSRAISGTSGVEGKLTVVNLGDIALEQNEKVMFVKTSSTNPSTVVLTYTDVNGVPDSIEGTTSYTGCIVIDLGGMSAIYGAKLSVSSHVSIENVAVTTAEKALYIVDNIPSEETEDNERPWWQEYELPNPEPEDLIVENIVNVNDKYEPVKEDEKTEITATSTEPERFGFEIEGRILFEDVKTSHWFRDEVITAYKLGLVKGKDEDLFDPFGNVTIAEAITLAVRLNYAYNHMDDDVEQPKNAEWYTNYVAKAIELGITEENQFENYNAPALRRQIAVIISKSVPKSYLNLINSITSIPDVPNTDPDFETIRRLYNVGIVQGSDGEFNFYPDSNITRAEMAAIINRVALPENRKRNITEKERLAKIKTYNAIEIATNVALVNCVSDEMVYADGSAVAMAATKDPIMFFNNLGREFNGTEVSQIRILMKWDTSIVENPTENGCKMFFTTAEYEKWNLNNYLSATWDGTFDENGFAELIFDCKSNKQFQNYVVELRFDPFDAIASFEIKQIVIE